MKVTTAQYAKILLELTENKTEKEISSVVLRFAEILKRDGQMKNAGKIVEKFSEIYNAKHGIVEAAIVTRQKIERQDVDRIEKFIKEKYGAKEVVINNVVDKNIKGGIIVKVGDEILDGSVSSQLKRLKVALIK